MVCSSVSKKKTSMCFYQYYKSKHFDDIKKIISKELCVEGNIYDILEEYLKQKKRNFMKYMKNNMKINLLIIEMRTKKKNKN